MRTAAVLVAVATLASAAAPARADCTLTSTGNIPVNDLGPASYLGFPGGLYPDGLNRIPAAHAQAGLAAAARIVPRNAAGNPDPANGLIVLVSIGPSLATQEFEIGGPWSFKPRVDADPGRNPRLVLVDGAQNSQAGLAWSDPAGLPWDELAMRLDAAGVTPAQVQAAWVKLPERGQDVPDSSFPAHAVWQQGHTVAALQILKAKYPNVQVAFLSGRSRSWSDVPGSLSPEPLAYESSFGVKWTIEQQIAGDPALNFDAAAGVVKSPWIEWGPYFWADGDVARSDGLTWPCSNVVSDFVHPSPAGETAAADMLMAFFKTDPAARGWFLRTAVTGQAPACAISVVPSGGRSPVSATFHAGASDPDGTVVETAWTFGDGGYSLASDPARVLPQPGLYPVRVSVTDDDGNSVLCTTDVVVSGCAVAPDTDGDGVGNACDDCPLDADPAQSDTDADGAGDACDVCPAIADPGQADSDGDGKGDACEILLTAPADGTLYSGKVKTQTFSWTSGGLAAFQVEFSATPNPFVPAYVSPKKTTTVSTSETPSKKTWKKIRKLGKKGGIVYWRVDGSAAPGGAMTPSDQVFSFSIAP